MLLFGVWGKDFATDDALDYVLHQCADGDGDVPRDHMEMLVRHTRLYTRYAKDIDELFARELAARREAVASDGPIKLAYGRSHPMLNKVTAQRAVPVGSRDDGLTRDELKNVLATIEDKHHARAKRYRVAVTPEDVDRLFEACDWDASGKISQSEAISVVVLWMNIAFPRGKLDIDQCLISLCQCVCLPPSVRRTHVSE